MRSKYKACRSAWDLCYLLYTLNINPREVGIGRYIGSKLDEYVDRMWGND